MNDTTRSGSRTSPVRNCSRTTTSPPASGRRLRPRTAGGAGRKGAPAARTGRRACASESRALRAPAARSAGPASPRPLGAARNDSVTWTGSVTGTDLRQVCYAMAGGDTTCSNSPENSSSRTPRRHPVARDCRGHLPDQHPGRRRPTGGLQLQPVPDRRRRAAAVPHRPAQAVPARARGDRAGHAVDRLRYIGFSHVEADESGAMNELLAAAPHAVPCAAGSRPWSRWRISPTGRRARWPTARSSSLGTHTSLDRRAARPARLGLRLAVRADAPHALCGDLFTQPGAESRRSPRATSWARARRSARDGLLRPRPQTAVPLERLAAQAPPRWPACTAARGRATAAGSCASWRAH